MEITLCLAGKVTPYVGVWIETVKLLDELDNYKVTPYVGVWIETFACKGERWRTSSHSLCGSVD